MLFYEEPSDPDFTGIELTFTPTAVGVTQPISVAKGEGVFSGDIHVTGSANLINGTEYTFTLKAVHADGSKSTGLTATVTPSDVVAAPLNVEAATADGEILLSWDEPAVNNWAFVEITFTPVVGVQPLAVSVGTTSISITGLANGTEYAFILTATDLFGIPSTDVLISATPSLTGDVTAPANISGVSSTVTPKGEVYDVLQYIVYGEGYNTADDSIPYDYFMPYMNLAGNPTNGICNVVWTDPGDAAQTTVMLRYDFSYNADMALHLISANGDLDASGTIGDSAGETDFYNYTFNYISGVLSTIDLYGAFPGNPTIYHQYTLTNNVDGKPTQILLYFDAVNLTLDSNPSFKWDFTYDVNDKVSTVERSSDTDMNGIYTYVGKYEYVYATGALDSVPGYDNLNNKETEIDFIY